MPPATRTPRTSLPPSTRAHLAQLLAAAFHQDAMTRWMIPDDRRRAELLPGFFRVFVDLSASYDAVLTSPEGDAVLLHLPPQAHPDQDALDAAFAEALGPYAEALRTVSALQAERHPAAPPHYSVSFGGVRAGRRQSGLMSGLLGEVLARADRDGVAVHAEASSPGGEATLVRAGFTRLGPDIVLPGDGPALRPMWRDPR
ncbi:hypothetical protein [Streptomyces sp. WAC06614]|uniref:hypothetical protein n=1 Tax=Streptomyces sp. WAC06614 TaxID=2487416 RepID=UPI000F7815D5|nr:hypothetical protein [Streptomyces sp. WAC06614]RSS75596.1 hypothetical protein EF918_23775 [Streptomyces sp. WAC06614]